MKKTIPIICIAVFVVASFMVIVYTEPESVGLTRPYTRIGEYDGSATERVLMISEQCLDKEQNPFKDYAFAKTFNGNYYIDNVICERINVEQGGCLEPFSKGYPDETCKNRVTFDYPYGETGPEITKEFCNQVKSELLILNDNKRNDYLYREYLNICTIRDLIDKEWTKTKSLDEIQENPDLIKQNIFQIEDGRIALYPANMCASLTLKLPTEQDIQRYKNDDKGLDDTNTLQITSSDLKEIPNIQELIYAVHSIEFPYNKYSSLYLDGLTFVEYEFFLMEKAMKKYGDSQEDYFIKLDKDYEERFTNPAKQGFTNHFEAPVIIYNNNAYSVSSTNFWTSDEHEPRRMGIFPIDSIEDDEKFITLTDEDMKSIPKIKKAIENIGTIKESISASKGLPEDQWNEYQEWFKQKSQDRLNSDWFRFVQYDKQIYSVGFSIC